LGGTLFERGARGVSLTESGKVLFARASWLLGVMDDIKAEVRTENREPSGTVRLGAPSSLADILYAPLAQLFARKFPRVRIEMSEGLTEVMCDRLLRAELDVAIVSGPQPNDHIMFETLVVERVFVIGPPRDPLLKAGKLTRKQFSNLPSAVVPLSRNLFPPSIPYSFRVDSSTPLKRIVAAGLGYGVLPFSGIHQEIAAETLSAALLPWARAERAIALPRGRPISRATHEVISALKTVCSELIKDQKILTAPPASAAPRRHKKGKPAQLDKETERTRDATGRPRQVRNR
jgi:LysR family nitrogen assimilation transcriptional regulator